MRIQEIHERYDNWKILGNTIQLLDKDKKTILIWLRFRDLVFLIVEKDTTVSITLLVIFHKFYKYTLIIIK